MNELAQVLEQANAITEAMDAGMMPDKEAWRITNREQAAWAMGKLYDLGQQMQARHAEAERALAPLLAQIKLIEDWRDGEVDRLDDAAEFFRGHLTKYLANERAADPKLKSIQFPHGIVASRKKPDGIEIADEKALLAAIKAARPEFIRVKEELDKARIKEAVLKDGEIIEGVRHIEGDLVYEVKIAGVE